MVVKSALQQQRDAIDEHNAFMKNYQANMVKIRPEMMANKQRKAYVQVLVDSHEKEVEEEQYKKRLVARNIHGSILEEIPERFVDFGAELFKEPDPETPEQVLNEEIKRLWEDV